MSSTWGYFITFLFIIVLDYALRKAINGQLGFTISLEEVEDYIQLFNRFIFC